MHNYIKYSSQTPSARKKVGSWGQTSTFQNWAHLPNSRCRYSGKIYPIKFILINYAVAFVALTLSDTSYWNKSPKKLFKVQ